MQGAETCAQEVVAALRSGVYFRGDELPEGSPPSCWKGPTPANEQTVRVVGGSGRCDCLACCLGYAQCERVEVV